jgi:xanthine dehydrogenase accessory factor
MIVMPDGSIIGTIGGGKLEADVIIKSGEVIREGRSRVVDYEFSGADAAAMDMICGGSALALMDHITAESNDFWGVIQRSQPNHVFAGWLATTIRLSGGAPSFIPLKEARQQMDPWETWTRLKYRCSVKQWGTFYIEPVDLPSRLFIFGAGHAREPSPVFRPW